MNDMPQQNLGIASFWHRFETETAATLVDREPGFRAIFQHLDSRPGPVLIVETGCARTPGNWRGEGQSTLLFDRYITARDAQSACHSVDISAKSIATARTLVSPRIALAQDDSVAYLHRLCTTLPAGRMIDLLYLDSYDLDPVYWFPAAAHHLKELLAASPRIGPDTLVIIDDSPMAMDVIPKPGNGWIPVYPPAPGGKGRLVAEYAATIGVPRVITGYQMGWKGF